MKKKIIDLFKPLFKDKTVFGYMFLVSFLGILFWLILALNTQFVDRLIYSRYTFFGTEHYYKDVWYYRLIVSTVGIVLMSLHNFIIAKIYKIFGKRYTLFFAVLSIVVAIIGIFIITTSIREIPNQ
jgi:hypothetical protein